MPSALKTMLNICCKYASDHGLEFNTTKSQLICFRHSSQQEFPVVIHMNDEQLQFSDKVTHLGHTLSYNLCDRDDIVKATKDLNRKANYILSTFKCAYPSIKSFLLKSFCLSLYDSVLWFASSPDIKIIETAMNHHLRRIWKLPRNSHMAVCHCLGQVSSIGNILFKHFQSFYSSALSSSSPLYLYLYLMILVLSHTHSLAITTCMDMTILGLTLIMIYLSHH